MEKSPRRHCIYILLMICTYIEFQLSCNSIEPVSTHCLHVYRLLYPAHVNQSSKQIAYNDLSSSATDPRSRATKLICNKPIVPPCTYYIHQANRFVPSLHPDLIFLARTGFPNKTLKELPNFIELLLTYRPSL